MTFRSIDSRVWSKPYKASRRRLTSYSSVIGLVVHDLIRHFRKTAVLILVAGTGGFLLELASLLLVLRYATLLEAGSSIELLGSVFVARQSPQLLLLTLSAVLSLLLLAALCNYLSGRATVMLRRRYELFAASRALQHMNRLRHVKRGEQPTFTEGEFTKILRRDPRYGGRIANMLIGSVLQLVIGVSMFCWLMWVHPWLTLILLLLVAPVGIMLYRTNVRGARASRTMEQAAPAASRAIRQSIRRLRSSPAPLPDDAAWFDRKILRQHPVSRLMDAYSARLMATPTAALWANLLFAAAIVAMLAAFGWQILQDDRGWSGLIAFIIGLRFFLTSVRQIMARLTSINRFFPQLLRYAEFIRPTAAPAPWRVGDTVEIALPNDTDALNGSADRALLTRGCVAAVLWPHGIDRFVLSTLLRVLLGRSRGVRAAADAWFVSRDIAWIDGCTWREGLGLYDPAETERFLDLLKALGAADSLLCELSQSLDTPVSAEHWQALDAQACAIVSVARAAAAESTWTLVDSRVIEALPESASWQKHFSKGFIFEVASHPRHIVAESTATVIVADEFRIRGIGTMQWLMSCEGEVLSIMHVTQDDRQTFEADDDDDEQTLE